MTMLVSLEQTKIRLRIDQDAEDDDLEMFIRSASDRVLAHLNYEPDTYEEDSNGDALDVPEVIKNATLMLIGILYRDRDGKESQNWELGYLPRPVVSLLYHLRDPTLS